MPKEVPTFGIYFRSSIAATIGATVASLCAVRHRLRRVAARFAGPKLGAQPPQRKRIAEEVWSILRHWRRGWSAASAARLRPFPGQPGQPELTLIPNHRTPMPAMGSDDELGAMLAAAPPSPAAADSDDDIAFLVDAVAAQDMAEDRYAFRGHRLCRMMRERKGLIGQARPGKVAPHVLANIAAANADWAKTEENLIDLTQRKPPRLKGRGKYRQWIPAALQRACWGLRPRPRVAKKVKRRRAALPRRRVAPAPTVTSTHMYSVFARAAGTHVQAVRTIGGKLHDIEINQQ